MTLHVFSLATISNVLRENLIELNQMSVAFVLYVHECVLRVCECVSSLSHRLMGTRRIHAEGLPGACSQAFYMETVRNRYVSRLRHTPLFHSHTCACTTSTHTHIHSALNIFTEHAYSLFLFSSLLCCSLLHTLISYTHSLQSA